MSAEHSLQPSPPARRPGEIVALLFALAAGPAGWIAQLVVDYGLAGYACFGGPWQQVRASSMTPGGEMAALVVFNLAGFVLAAAGVVVGYRCWRGAGDDGPRAGRTRFLAQCGLMASAGFAMAILFDTAEPFVTPACWRFGG